MKRRIFSLIFVLMLTVAAVTVSVLAADQEITVLSQNLENLVITTDTYIDLNGYSIAGVTVENGATLYISDSQTDDYTVADGVYGKLTGATGNVQAAEGYVAITGEEAVSFHCVDMQISAMSLRPGNAGLYYTGSFSGDEMVAQYVQSFGIALSTAAEPTELNMDSLCEYSVFTDFTAGTHTASGTLLTGIMREDNTDEENVRNAAMPVYGRPYIQTADGYIFGNYVTRDLQTQVEAVDGIWAELNEAQKAAVLAMYEKYRSVMVQWDIPYIMEAGAEETFVSKFRGDFLYRAGNQNAVRAGSLFAAAEGTEVTDATVTVQNISGTAAGTYTAGSSWTEGKLSFSGLGVVEVTVSAAGAIPVSVPLEIVDAVNSTTATNATANNVVLLNDTGFGSVTVSGGYTLYGNGFTMTCSTDSPALDMGYAFVTLENGNLDNVQIVCPNFWYASLYKGNLTSPENETQVEGTRTRYYNARSAVMASGSNTVSNCYISGGRAAIYLTAGTTVLDNTTVYGGAAANIHVLAGAGGLVMRDVKLIQEPIRATARDKTIMGMSVVLMSADGMATVPPITLEGELIQYAWIDAEDAQYIPEDTSAIVEEVFAQKDFIHLVDGKESVNLGFVVCPADDKSTGALTVYDNRTNQDTAPYGQTVLDIVFVGDVTIFSCTNENGTDPAFLSKPVHTPAYHDLPLQLDYADVNENRVLTKAYNPVTNAWEYQLVVNLDAGDYSLDFAQLQVLDRGVPVAFTVTDPEGNAVDVDAKLPLSVGNVSYTLTAQGTGIRFTTVATREEILAPTLVSADYESGLCVATSYGGTWSGAAPALEGIQIRYYSVAEGGYKTVDLSACTPTTPGQQNGTNNTWFYEAEDGDFTLTLTGGQVHSSNNIYAMPVVCNGKLYFVASSSKGLVNSGNTARTVKVSYAFRDNATDTALTFTHTWSVEENQEEQYSYSKFCSGTLTKLTGSGSTGCFTEGTMITLADGTQKPIEQITYEDELLAWDFHTGAYVATVPSLIESHEAGEYRVINLKFSDGTVARVVVDHGFFDVAENNFVFIDEENVESYIGHEFVQVGGNGTYHCIELVGYEITVENIAYYTIQTAFYNNCIAENLFTLTSPPEGVDGWFDYFEIGEGMQYDEAKMQADIEKYGLYTYEDFAEYVTYEQFLAFNGPYLKVLVGRGVLSYADILRLIAIYVQ